MGVSGPSPSTDGFGLAQVRERLATTYGPQATIELIANEPGNTCARVSFPA
jgi:LytS/YehU family sensor histidine kinase